MVNDMASIVTCFEAVTGKSRVAGAARRRQREGFSASPVAVDGKMFFTNDEGETFVLRAGPKFELLARNRIGEGTLASPALVDGRWYIRTEQQSVRDWNVALWALGLSPWSFVRTKDNVPGPRAN